MVEVAVAMSMASTAFNTIKKGIEMGREAQDIAQYFGNWFEAKDCNSQKHNNMQTIHHLQVNCFQVNL